jgi:predicted HicB family RNase H-like nuclease
MRESEKIINLAIPAELHKKMKVLAAEKGSSVKALVKEALERYCAAEMEKK